MICHFLSPFVSFSLCGATHYYYKNVVKYYSAQCLTTIWWQCTLAHVSTCTRCISFSSRAVPLGRCLLDANHENRSRNGRIYGGNAGQDASFSFLRSAARVNFACPKSPKIFTTFAFSLPRGQRSLRHLEQSPGVYGFFVSLSSSRLSQSFSFLFCIVRRARISRQHCPCSSNTCTTSVQLLRSISMKCVIIFFFFNWKFGNTQ